MGDRLLSLSWSNHQSSFYHVISNLKKKERYSDATLACNGEFYPVHKLVLSVCSDYFDSMLDKTPCKHPIIVLKDVRQEDLESILNYMYLGSVSVPQSDLARLIKTAESLGIKGLAVSNDYDSCKPGSVESNCESAESTKMRVSPSPKHCRIKEKRSSSSNVDIDEISDFEYEYVAFPSLSSNVKIESRLNESRDEDPLKTCNETMEFNAESTLEPELDRIKVLCVEAATTEAQKDEEETGAFKEAAASQIGRISRSTRLPRRYCSDGEEETKKQLASSNKRKKIEEDISTPVRTEPSSSGMEQSINEKILNRLDDILVYVKQMDGRLENVDSKMNILTQEIERKSLEDLFVPLVPLEDFNLPMKSLDEVLIFDAKLEDDEKLMQLLIKRLSLEGHQLSVSKAVRYIMHKLLTNRAAVSFNFAGKGGKKKAFSAFTLLRVLKAAVRVTHKFATEEEIEDTVKLWLKHAPTRSSKIRTHVRVF